MSHESRVEIVFGVAKLMKLDFRFAGMTTLESSTISVQN